MAFFVECDIPPPNSDGKGSQPRRFPWRELQPGQAVTGPCADHKEAQRIRSSVQSVAKATGRKFTTRRTDDGMIRVWRIE